MDWKSVFLLPPLFLCLSIASPIYAKGFSRQKSKKSLVQPSNSPFSLKAPNGWERIDDAKQLPEKVKLLYVGKGKGQFTPSINLACEETQMSLSEYVQLAKQYHESLPETNCSLVGKVDTKQGEAQLIQIDRKTGWGDLRFLQASIISNGVAYVITATATEDEFLGLYPYFYQAIQSFQYESEKQS